MNDTFYPSPGEAFKSDPPTAREYDDSEHVGANGDVYDPDVEEHQ